MSFVNGTFSLICNKCSKQHNFRANDADFDETSGSERQMGPENGYTWEYIFNCDQCENEIEIEYEVWEYPVGAFNNDQVEIKGGTEVNRYGYDFQDAPEPDDL
jgi:hypothetical protein